MRDETILAMFLGACVTALEAAALATGNDGQYLPLILAALGAIATAGGVSVVWPSRLPVVREQAATERPESGERVG